LIPAARITGAGYNAPGLANVTTQPAAPIPTPKFQQLVLDIARCRSRGKKIIGSKSKPMPEPVPFPKLFARSMQRII